jgi:hypothetical protein
MNAIYEITAVDDVLVENMFNDKEFFEFSHLISELTSLTANSIYLEDVKDSTPDLRKFGSEVKKNTWDTTKDIGHAYGNIVGANANLIKATWDIIMRAINLISRALAYIINKITNIPKFILKTADRAAAIPGEVKAKIKGNITLYIRANDIEVLYNNLLMQRLTEYITLASELSKGEFWSTITKKRIGENGKKGHLVFGTNDMKLCKKMDKVYEHLQNTEFNPTIIEIKEKSIVDIYFGDSKSIKFTDNYGKKHECTYYEALTIMIGDLEGKKKELQDVHVAVGEKLRKTEANQNYNDLDNPSKYRLNTTISQISKVVSIIGNFVKYIIADLNTINSSVDKILSKSSLPKVDAKKAASTSADKVNTNV